MGKKETRVTRTPVKLDPPKQVDQMIQLDHANAPLYTAKFLEQIVFATREIAATLKELQARK